ncbi:MAG: HAE1 family hydrophobic/amphiphilic exporter-1, partial [Planctomycetota bacterium]
MNLIQNAIRQPVTVAVGVIMMLLGGLVAVRSIPIQLTPNVEDTIIAVTTNWEGASPEEIEQEIIDPQEEKLQGIANLREMTSTSLQGSGSIRLEFAVGTPKEIALREVSDKLREVPSYPDNADEPVVNASDPDNKDYIAWIMLSTEDTEIDIRTLRDFAEDRIKPVFERVQGISEINVLGGIEREAQVRFDAVRLAERGISVSQLVDALRRSNRNVSAGAIAENKSDVRVRLVNQFTSPEQVARTVIAQTDSGPVRVSDVAEVVEAFKEPYSFVRGSGKTVIAINAQKEVGVNVIEVMAGLRAAIVSMNLEGGLLENQAKSLGLSGDLSVTQVYDQTVYIDDALELIKQNIWIGGGLAMLVLLLFLRSIRSAGIIALAIPISIVGAIAAMIGIGRTVNVISLAGMAFAVGMVVDNAIVVLENIYRHLELGKSPRRAALDGAREVFGAVLAATLTTVVVFIPILLIEDEAGQLFRDIALAIVAAVTLSLVVSVTVIPTCAARILKRRKSSTMPDGTYKGGGLSGAIGNLTYWLGGSVIARLLIVFGLTTASIMGSLYLLPPADYLPQGNRNLAFGLLITPPGYNVDQQQELAYRLESTIEPFWEAGKHEVGSAEYETAKTELPEIPTFDYAKGAPGDPVVPPPLTNYFVVSTPGTMFHGGISAEPDRVIDYIALFGHATRAEMAPGVLAFAFQVPLFNLGGSTGSAIKINFSGDNLDEVTAATMSVYRDLMAKFSPYSVRPDPSNFSISGPELRLTPDLVRLSEVGMSVQELGVAIQALGDGAIIGDYRVGGQNIDLKVISKDSGAEGPVDFIGQAPIATPLGSVVPLSSLAQLTRVNSAQQINRIDRRRSVTLQFTPPAGVPLEQAMASIDAVLASHQLDGSLPPSVDSAYTGTASKLASVQRAMFGDGSLSGTVGSAMVLALIVVYLLMCVLFQSFLRPLIIMFSVPLATLGGFAALYGVFLWSQTDPYMPVQNLDILTLLGFVILIGVVVNNAILIVHQARNFMLGDEEGGERPLEPRRAISEAVRSRVRPIFMGTLTSVGGMLPLVLMPGSGSELYRGLGSVVVGGLVVSTLFTLLLVPALLSLLTDFQARIGILETGRDRDDSGIKSSGATTAAVLLLFILFLPGCGGPSASRRPRMQTVMHDVIEQQLLGLTQEGQTEVRASTVPTRVEEVLEGSLEELDAAGGPSSYAKLKLQLPKTLEDKSPELQEVDLVWSVTKAAEYNLAVRLTREQTQADLEGVTIASAEFDSTMFADLVFDSRNEPRAVPRIGSNLLGAPDSASDESGINLGLRKLLSGGGAFTTSTSLDWVDNRTEGIAFTPDSSYRAGVAVTFEQPLMRGYGQEVTLAQEVLSRSQYERSEFALREELLIVMQVAANAFWDLQLAWKVLAVQQQLTERGEEVERVLRERRAFDATPAEYSDALATLERRRANLVRAKRLVAQASDRLKYVVNDPQLPLANETLLQPSGEMVAEEYAYDLRQMILRALRERPEVQQAMLEIEDSELRQRVAGNDKDPLLDLRAGVSIAGLDGDPGDSYSSMVSDDYLNFFVGLAFEVPSGNRAAEARLRQAQVASSAALIAYEDVVRQV